MAEVSGVLHDLGRYRLHFKQMSAQRMLARGTWLVLLLGSAIVALLVLRVWLQLTGDTSTGGLIGTAYDASGVLASPFKSFEPSTPMKTTGILEFSSLVAIEAYLIATMATLTLLLTLRLALAAAPHIVHDKKRLLPAEPPVFVPPERPVHR
jgi:hypothetical protein